MVEQDSSVADVQEAQNDEEMKGQYAEEDLGCTDRERFLLELEFIQCLASPQYIHWLAQNQWLDDPDFLRYLKYLNYWRRPEYAKYLIYPHCLFFLEMLQSKDFRKAMARDTIKEMVHRQQFYFWQFYRNNRANEALGEDSAPAEEGGPWDQNRGQAGSQRNASDGQGQHNTGKEVHGGQGNINKADAKEGTAMQVG